MISALWNGVSGISNYDKGISVESNNIANSSTTGHKLDEITFADMLYTNGGYGKGVTTQSISKQFGQGNINPTSGNLDVAINGKGFFIVTDKAGETYYTRAGDFKQTKDGWLQTQDGMNVLGLVPQNKLISSTNPQDTQFTTEYSKNIISTNINDGKGTISNINAKTTDYTKTATTDDPSLKGDNYKSAQAKVRDVDALITDYLNKLSKYDVSQASVASVSQISKVDFSSQFANLSNKGNSISLSIDGQSFSVAFDNDGIASQQDMQDIYNFLSPEGRTAYGLSDPSTIPTQTQVDDLFSAIPDQAVIDAMPTSTPAEIAAKAAAQAQKDQAVTAYQTANQTRVDAQTSYNTAKNAISAYKDLADKISNTAGYSASVKDGVLTVESLVAGKSFNITNAKVNEAGVNPTITQSAIAGSGTAMLDSARDALKQAIEKAGGKFLEITNVMEYANLGSYGTSNLNLRLDTLGLVEGDLGQVSISDDGFVFVKSGDNKFLVGRISTAAFVNEQGLDPVGDNKYSATKSSGTPYNADGMNKMQEKSLERSNVEYSSTLTSLMVYQKAFEASSKSITTSDDFLKTAIEMVK
ncbi:flagellar hook-basal body complex protein [Aliarcobacter butzleri]|uniref:flagellar hook-basal body complex protein n=1 Tax=Aliarcobacter butzleri TaxID=28197 RepID=UPI0021B2A83C|nr:flagellar hook-basal body complex protein [Aliarcobacter butzleri]MCT7565615.1 flagellar hook-basal body complex protein [Aliarcobacter butzleri]MCT7569881.1 flagellar hook-basal body complex protein [Aliarcobacter butzleri]MCT7632403.1 flagellar hook-basal body complex protein [Aliarcobacter butzleri]MCT7645837.1 flagellar hook-basal body complex protein [Aliarcobacter butzleri]MDK2081172.1 flagellar hook-basal body complex protein [Aliarcobacter butzleri]